MLESLIINGSYPLLFSILSFFFGFIYFEALLLGISTFRTAMSSC